MAQGPRWIERLQTPISLLDRPVLWAKRKPFELGFHSEQKRPKNHP